MLVLNDRLPGGSQKSALLFAALFIAACSVFWIGERLPLVDIPQHAGQIAALRDMMLGQFKWADLVTVNYFTPYILTPGLSALLALIMPVPVVISLVLTLAYGLYVVACLALRRELKADPQFDFLFLIGMFGFAYCWGFYNYLFAVPFSLFFMLAGMRYAANPTLKRGMGLFLLGCLLFAMHELAFLFACFIGGLLLLGKGHPLPVLIRATVPYAFLGVLLLAYTLTAPAIEPASEVKDLWVLSPYRILYLWNYTWTGNPYSIDALSMLSFFCIVTIICHLAFIPVERLRWTPNWILMIGFMACWLLVPIQFNYISYLYLRLNVYFMPFLAFLFVLPSPGNIIVQRRYWLLPVMCAGLIGANIAYVASFASENNDYNRATAGLEPGQRALSLIIDTNNSAFVTEAASNYAVWYQSEHGGWVDFNFASFFNQVVHYKPGYNPTKSINYGHSPLNFNWQAMHGRDYRYFFVRVPANMSDEKVYQLLANDECQIALVGSSGKWRIFERTACKD